jgi:KUP system potassium uptake protein
VVTSSSPRVLPAARSEVINVGDGIYEIVLRYGFMEEPDIPRGLTQGQAQRVHLGDDVAYFLAGESVRATELPGMAMWRERLYGFLNRNATPAATWFSLPPDRTVTLGVHVDL